MKKFIIKKYKIYDREYSTSENKPQDCTLRFVFVTDLHNVSYGAHNEELVRAIQDAAPDAVLLGGDLVLGKPGKSFSNAMCFVKQIAGMFPTYYANGNHEQRLYLYPETYGSMYEEFLTQLSQTKAIYLVNESVDIVCGKVPVRIHGFQSERSYYKRLQSRKVRMPVEELTNVFGEPDREHFHVLLAHNPSYTETYLDWGANLTFCGHFHGGVVRIGKHRGVINPNLQLFSKYCYGMYERDNRCVIISAGLGEHSVPLRIHNPYELVVTDVYVTDE